MKLNKQLENVVLIKLSEKFEKIRPVFFSQPRSKDYHLTLKQYKKLHTKILSITDLEHELSSFSKHVYMYENNIEFNK